MKSYKFIITGKVQGVYYRVSVKSSALKFHYKGYVKNLPDGSVEACVSCLEKDVAQFVKILKSGSLQSRVDDIKQKECDEVFTSSFEVR